MKYLSELKKVIRQQFEAPEEDFVKFFASKVYDGILTAKVKCQFTEITTKALSQFLNESINDRLKSAIGPDVHISGDEPPPPCQDECPGKNPKIVTTDEEIQGYNIVKAIVRQRVDAERIAQRDTQNYFGVLLDDNNRKPICRLHFNRCQKYIGLFDDNKKEIRFPIDRIDDIFQHDQALLDTVSRYELKYSC
ncbi:MAG: hypothetical protein MI742_09880 [Desulfobacterales bacterium]|nr:hypothetical protein [Desulfobacterales bacterium]